MKALIYLFGAIILFSVFSCKKESVTPTPVDKQLIGKWKFESMTLGLGGQRYVADPSQVDMIEFKADHSYQRSVNGTPGGKGTYELSLVNSIFSNKKDNAIILRPEQSIQNIVSIKNDSLYMAQNVYDGFSSVFSRVK